MKNKIGLWIAVAVLCLGMMTACGGDKIEDAQSLLKANKEAQAGVESFHMDADIDMDMTMSMEGMEAVTGSSDLNMPMEMDLSMDCGKETAHGTMKMDIETLGEAGEQESEMYCDMKNGAVYTKTEGLDQWVKSEQNANMADIVDGLQDLNSGIVDKAEFKEGSDGYILTLKGKDLGDSLDAASLVNGVATSGMEVTDLDISGGTITYTFDKDTLLVTAVDMEKIKVDAEGTSQGADVKVGIVINGAYDFSKYNELVEGDYAIPDEVLGGTEETTETTQSETEATGGALPKATTQITVDGNTTPNGQGWYVVGQDSIPAGTYQIFHGDGQGVLTVKSSGGSVLGEWTIGFDGQDELEDGSQVTVQNGDNVFITQDLHVVFDPV